MRLGIVGTGKIVGWVAPNLAGWDVEIVAIAGTPRSSATVEAMADKYRAAGRYTDWHDLMADVRVDTVYVATPNSLHYDVTEAALLAGKDVICEKPLTSRFDQAEKLARLAKKRGRFLWEAVVTTRQPNYKTIKRLLPRIGTVKMASVTFSQYSSRYDAFRAGEVLPAFDPAKAGGALMDLGLYTLTFTLGLFGEPLRATYVPNIERGIDTSGVAILEYDGFTALSICAKDSGAPNRAVIQGIDGWLCMDSVPSICGAVTLRLNDGTEELYDDCLSSVYEAEFRQFKAQQEAGDLQACFAELEESLLVNRIQNEIRRKAGVIFPSD
jgi:predicted dehydrogenase